ncbi:alpha/beta hydrolase [Salipaludibacillus sp. HK11]|uniref:alpha/beta hydrolase n=1 Tax=Salipaludibacillus sp. HK11 TaxID=3394320 RepID=UPI0039FC3FCD
MYGLHLGLFYFNQEKSLFLQPQLTEESAHAVTVENDNVQEITIEVEDEVNLRGWLVDNRKDNISPSPLLIYFGGNGEELSRIITQFEALDNWSVLLMNYRGYGLSDGTPSEENLFHDATKIHDVITNQESIDENTVVAMGRSMGTAPATHLSKKRDMSGTILVSPYDSRTELSKHRHPFLPIDWLIRHPFELSDKAPNIDSALLAFIASEDRVIPPDHSEVTIQSWAGKTEEVWLDGVGHNNLQSDAKYLENINQFLARKIE